MLNPRYTSCGLPPLAICPIVVPKTLVKFSCSVCPPVRFSIPTPHAAAFGSYPEIRGVYSPTT